MEFVDQQLVVKSQKGDTAAFAELVNMYKHKIYGYCYRMVGNAQDAEDITQEVFLRLYRHLPTYDPNRRFTTWLFTIANNLCIDHLRRKRPAISLDQPVNHEGDLMWELADDGPDPAAVAEHAELVNTVEEAIASLPDNYRSVIILRHIQELSYEEISHCLELPLNTVKTRIHRAREALAKRLRHL